MPSGRAVASVDGHTLAEATTWEEVEGNVYFPPDAVRKEHFVETALRTHCGWKGDASYYTITVGDKKLENAAWFYASPMAAADHIKNYVAFYKSKVEITKTT